MGLPRKGVKTPILLVRSTIPALKDGVIVFPYFFDINTLTQWFSLGVNDS